MVTEKATLILETTKPSHIFFLYNSTYKCSPAQPKVISRSPGDKYDKLTKFWGEKSIGVEILGVDSIPDLV